MKFRFENDSMYVYDENHKAYLFVTRMLGRSEEQAIEDYEDYEQENMA